MVVRPVSWSCSTRNFPAGPRTGCHRSITTRLGSSPCPPKPPRNESPRRSAALGNGFAATRGCREEDGPGHRPSSLVSGVYDDGDDDLLPGPNWTGLEPPDGSSRPSERRLLDLRTGTLVRSGNLETGLRSMRFVSVASPHAMALRAEAIEGNRRARRDPLLAPGMPWTSNTRDVGDVRLARTGRDSMAGSPSLQRITVGRWITTSSRLIERLAAWTSGRWRSDLPRGWRVTSPRRNPSASIPCWPSTARRGRVGGQTLRS